MAEFKFIGFEKTDITATITLRRDDLNHFNITMLGEITAALWDISNSRGIKLLVFKAEGIAFCGGFDYDSLPREDFEKLIYTHHKTILLLEKIKCPTICLLQGAALGAGFELAIACDFVLAVEGAKVGFPEIKKGHLPTVAMAMASYVGHLKHINELIMTGDTITVEEAKIFGMINHVYPRDDFRTRCEEFVYRLTSNPGEALYHAKKLIRDSRNISFEQVLERIDGNYPKA